MKTEHDCPSCSCLNMQGVRDWMAVHLIHAPHPQGFDFYLSDVYASYLNYTFDRADPDHPVLTQNLLTRNLRRMGVSITNSGGRGNKLSGWHLA